MALYPCFEKFSSFRVKKNQNIIPTAIRIFFNKNSKNHLFLCVLCYVLCTGGGVTLSALRDTNSITCKLHVVYMLPNM